MRAALVVLAALASVLVSACGGEGDSTGEVATDEPVRAMPACAGAGAEVSPPASFPSDFPLPPGTVITSAKSPYESQLVLLGFIPADLQEAAAYFSDALPERGYEVGIGDAEGVESEAPFTGNGFRGKWRVNGIEACPAVRLTLVLIEQA